MAIASKGYGTDEIGEAEWAQMAAHIGSPYSYSSPNALRPTPASGLNRGVQLADGSTFGWGIKDDVSGERVQLPSVASGTAQHMIVLRREWGAGKRKTTAVTLPMAGAAASGRRTSPGNVDDQPVCLATVSAGSPVVTGIVDLRLHAGKSYYAPSLQAASYDPILGARYVLPNGDRYIGTLSPAGTVQVTPEKMPDQVQIPEIPKVASGTASVTFSNTGSASITHGLGRRPKTILVGPGAIASSAQITVDLAVGSTAITTNAFAVVAKRATATAPFWAPYTGNLSELHWIAVG